MQGYNARKVISEVYASFVLYTGSIFHIKKSMKYSGRRKLLHELSKFSKFNAFILLVYYTNTDAPILVHKFRPERTGFNMYAENTQLTFLALQPCNYVTIEMYRMGCPLHNFTY